MYEEAMQLKLHKLIDPMTPNGEYLYHYTTLNKAFEYILYNGSLRLGLVKLTNDPKESKDWNWTFRNTPQNGFSSIDGMTEIVDKNSYINSKIKEGCKLCCFSLDNETRNAFSGRGWGRPRMWAQYADNHKGVCLVFDKKQLIENAVRDLFEKGSLFYDEVKYLNDEKLIDENAFVIDYMKISDEGIDNAINTLVKEKYKQYFFTKHIDWQQEREFRIFLKGGDDNPEYLSIDKALVALIVGGDFPIEAYRPLIEFYCQRYDMPYGFMKWHNGMPSLQSYIINS